MLEFAIMTYGMLASFVMASASRNRKEQRPHPPILVLFGWALLSFSAAGAALLIGYAGLTGGALPIG